MTTLVVVAVVYAGIVLFVAPWVDHNIVRPRRRRRRELARVGGRVRYITDTPRFTRDDPSPRPRRGDAA